jgi:hypothetical protein
LGGGEQCRWFQAPLRSGKKLNDLLIGDRKYLRDQWCVSVFGTGRHLPEESGLFESKLFPQLLQLSVLSLHIGTAFRAHVFGGWVVAHSVISSIEIEVLGRQGKQ